MSETTAFFAIQEMRRLSKQGKPFSFSYASYSKQKQESDGIKTVNKAVLRQSAKGNDDMLYYFDLDSNQNKKCHQILLLSFNNKKVVLQ